MPHSPNPQPPDGIARIAAERARQLSEEGWTPEHDATHTDCELLGAAINYAVMARFIARYQRTDGQRSFHGLPPEIKFWPPGWDDAWWKPDYTNPIRNLEKAGALIAAEIDRLLRLKCTACEGTGRSDNQVSSTVACPTCEGIGLVL